MKKAIALVFAGLFLISVQNMAAHAATGALDGKAFSGKIGPKGAGKKFEDEVIFKDGKFTSSACKEKGFDSADYSATTEGKKTTFEATTTNKDGDTMVWKGFVFNGKKVEASITKTTKSDGTSETWMYKGFAKGGTTTETKTE